MFGMTRTSRVIVATMACAMLCGCSLFGQPPLSETVDGFPSDVDSVENGQGTGGAPAASTSTSTDTAPSGDGEGTVGDAPSDAGDGSSTDIGSGVDEQLEGPELRARGITKGDSGKRSFGDTDLSWHVVVDGGLPCIDVDGDWLVSDSGSKFKATLAFVLDDGSVLCEVRPFSLSDFEGGAVQGSLRLEFDGLSGHGVSAEDAMCDIVRDTGGSAEDDVEYLSHVFGW